MLSKSELTAARLSNAVNEGAALNSISALATLNVTAVVAALTPSIVAVKLKVELGQR